MQICCKGGKSQGGFLPTTTTLNSLPWEEKWQINHNTKHLLTSKLNSRQAYKRKGHFLLFLFARPRFFTIVNTGVISLSANIYGSLWCPFSGVPLTSQCLHQSTPPGKLWKSQYTFSIGQATMFTALVPGIQVNLYNENQTIILMETGTKEADRWGDIHMYQLV